MKTAFKNSYICQKWPEKGPYGHPGHTLSVISGWWGQGCQVPNNVKAKFGQKCFKRFLHLKRQVFQLNLLIFLAKFYNLKLLFSFCFKKQAKVVDTFLASKKAKNRLIFCTQFQKWPNDNPGWRREKIQKTTWGY